MILVVGLGNVGNLYVKTRHNIGFLFADFWSNWQIFEETKDGFMSCCREKNIDGNRFAIQKPQTFMNESGVAVAKLCAFFKIPTENIYVFHDDIDLPFGIVKLKFSGGAGGHNGLRSIDQHIGKNYWRFRFGVGRPECRFEVAKYVLSDFSKEEMLIILEKIFPAIAQNFVHLLLASEKDEIMYIIRNDIK